MGINWVTVESLKTRVKRAYAETLKNIRKSDASPSQPTSHNSTDISGYIDIPPPPNAIETGITNNIEMPVRNKGGRPKGSTNEFKAHVDKCCTAAKNEITELYHSYYLRMKEQEIRDDTVRIGQWSKRVPKGTYQSIHDEVKRKRNLPDSFSFSYNACQKRIVANNLSITTPGKKSPLSDIEDHIVTLILALSDTGHPLTVGQCLPLINSLIQGTTHQQKLIAWKKAHSLHIDNNGNEIDEETLGEVGIAYWHGLVRRNKAILTTNKGRLFELSRTNWTLFRNFRSMYDDVEKHMVEAGVATPYDEPK